MCDKRVAFRWVPLETMSGLVLRIPGTAIALKVVPSEQGRASGGGRESSSMSSDLVAIAIPSHDLDAARAFYQQALGMQVAAGGQVRGAQVCLHIHTHTYSCMHAYIQSIDTSYRHTYNIHTHVLTYLHTCMSIKTFIHTY